VVAVTLAPGTPPIGERHLPLAGALNFRDLGGYPTTDGHTTRWRTVFRADGLHQLTDTDLETLRPVSLRTVIDLRTAAELDERGRFPVDAHPVAYHHLSIIDQTWDPSAPFDTAGTPAEFLHSAYRTMLDSGAEHFATAFQLLAGHDALPAVFHCAVGKDRTGLLAALLLGSLGVPRSVIVDDYALTQSSMDLLVERLRGDPDKASVLDQVPAVFFAADPAAMDLVIDDLETDHGSVRGYVRSLGVDDDVIEHLRDALLDR